MDQLHYPTDADKQKALDTIDQLIQRTESETSRSLYRKQREKIASASVGERVQVSGPPLGVYPPN